MTLGVPCYDAYIMYSPQCLSLAVLQATNAGVRRPGYEARVSLSECICGTLRSSICLHITVLKSRLQNYNTGTVTAAA